MAHSVGAKASDKCLRESECLSFYDHMRAVSVAITNQTDILVDPTIIFTSESREMVREQTNFVGNVSAQRTLPHSFRIVHNTEDVTPDSGFVASVSSSNPTFTADDSMMSAITSVSFQLLPRLTLGNCCSNFHVLLADLLAGGCGAARENDFLCMQENADPSVRICCAWHKDCHRQKQTELEQLAIRAATTS